MFGTERQSQERSPSNERLTIQEPLLLNEIPRDIHDLYYRLQNHIERKWNLNVVYVNGRKPYRRSEEHLRDLEIRLGQLIRYQDSAHRYGEARTGKGCVTFAKKDMESLNAKDAAELAVRETLRNDHGVVKIVSLDFQGSAVWPSVEPGEDNDPTQDSLLQACGRKERLSIPLWACGWIVIEDERFKDREIQFITAHYQLPSSFSRELQDVLLVHSLIEIGWWAPVKSRPPLVEDDKRLISASAIDNAMLWPLHTLELFERARLFEQHFENKKTTQHDTVECRCHSLKVWDRSFLMQRVNRVRDCILHPEGAMRRALSRTIEGGAKAEHLSCLNLIKKSFVLQQRRKAAANATETSLVFVN